MLARRLELRRPEDARRRLRLGVTASCNLNCLFCHGDGGQVAHYSAAPSPHSPATLSQLVGIGVDCGINKLKLTGGEPLLYANEDSGIVELVSTITAGTAGGQAELSMVTNGSLLTLEKALALKAAGLSRVSISLHASEAGFFARYAQPRAVRFGDVVSGIENAVRAGLTPVKLNCVVFSSRSAPAVSNLDQVQPLLSLAGCLGVDEVRFFVVVANPNLAPDKHSDLYVDWDDPLLDGVLPPDLLAEVRRALADAPAADRAFPGSFRVSFRYEQSGAVIPEVSFQRFGLPGRPGGPVVCGCQEGSYAIRFVASGRLKACLYDRVDRNIAAALSCGDYAGARAIFSACQAAVHDYPPHVVLAPAHRPLHAADTRI